MDHKVYLNISNEAEKERRIFGENESLRIIHV